MISALVLFTIALLLIASTSYLLGERVGSTTAYVPGFETPAKPPTRAMLRLQRKMIREIKVVESEPLP